jgi:hypothetical protein
VTNRLPSEATPHEPLIYDFNDINDIYDKENRDDSSLCLH